MWMHMMLVASIIIGPDVMNTIAVFFEDYYMVQVAGPFIAFSFLFHFVLAARKIPFRTAEMSSIWKHSKLLHHYDTWTWVIQVVTALVILIMGSIHMWTVLTDLPITAAKSAARIQGGFWMVFYVILLPMTELHVGIGFYRIWIKWRLVSRKGRKLFHVFETILMLTFIAIGAVTIYTFYTMTI